MRTVRIYEELLAAYLQRLPAPYIDPLRPLVMRHARQAQRLAATGKLTRRTAVEMAHEACRDIEARIASPEFEEALRAIEEAARPKLAAKPSVWRRLVVWARFCLEDIRAFFEAKGQR